jgi:hypothetical protein
MVVMVVMAIEQPIPKTMVVVATCIMRVLDHHGGCGLNPYAKITLNTKMAFRNLLLNLWIERSNTL